MRYPLYEFNGVWGCLVGVGIFSPQFMNRRQHHHTLANASMTFLKKRMEQIIYMYREILYLFWIKTNMVE